ncbi:MAG: uroporphyrinogen-III synthase [Bdellovibrionales bacterium]
MTDVLLTRPREASARLAARLGPMGYRCVIAPLLEIAPLHSSCPDLADLRAVMATSAHAFEGAALLDSIKSLPCYCVGSATAEKARAAGFRQVRDAQGDGAALAAAMAEGGGIRSGEAVLHLAGRDAHEAAVSMLTAQGVVVRPWVVYEARAAQGLPEAALAALRGEWDGAVLLFSTRTALIFADKAARYDLGLVCARSLAIGISKAAIAPVESLRWRGVSWAAQPTEEGVVARLRERAVCA